MTITICVLVPDGIVLAADSRQVNETITGQLRIDSDSANKIFQLGPRLATSIYGQSFFYPNRHDSPSNVGTLLQMFAKDLSEKDPIDEVAKIIHRKADHYLQQHYKATRSIQATLVFHLAGYRLGSMVGELYRCEVPGHVQVERQTTDAGMVWNGQREIVNRLILGYDPRLVDELGLAEKSAKQQTAGQLHLQKMQLHINFQTMPLQDAIDLAVSLITTTIELQRLSDGIVGAPGQFPTCGGAIQVAVITPEEGFQWVRHKELRV